MSIQFRLSGGDLNQNPNGSLGGIISSTPITTDILQNLFDNIKRNEALVGRTEYRCLYVINTGPSHISGATIEITVNPSTTLMSIGLDPAGKGDGVNTGVATIISTEDTTPTGPKFFGEDTSSADGPFDTVVLPLGLLKAGEAVAVWLKRVTEIGAQQILTVNLVVTHDAVTLPGEDFDDGGAIGELLKVTKQTTGTFVIGTAQIGLSDIAANP